MTGCGHGHRWRPIDCKAGHDCHNTSSRCPFPLWTSVSLHPEAESVPAPFWPSELQRLCSWVLNNFWSFMHFLFFLHILKTLFQPVYLFSHLNLVVKRPEGGVHTYHNTVPRKSVVYRRPFLRIFSHTGEWKHRPKEVSTNLWKAGDKGRATEGHPQSAGPQRGCSWGGCKCWPGLPGGVRLQTLQRQCSGVLGLTAPPWFSHFVSCLLVKIMVFV